MVTRSARKHGIRVEQIRRVIAEPFRTVVQGDAVLHIGLTPERDLLEVVVALGEPVTVLHAMRLRPANYRFLPATPSSAVPPMCCQPPPSDRAERLP